MDKLIFFWLGSCLINQCSCVCSSTTCPMKNEEKKEGNMQSPIDIITNKAEETELPSLRFSNHWDPDLNVYMFQVGNTVIVVPKVESSLSLEGGPLTGKFILDQLHFHWCTDSNNGSEHCFDGIKYAMEAHLVYYNYIYGSAKQAFNQPGGLTILAALMESKAIYHNGPFESVVNNLNKLVRPGEGVPLNKNVFKMFKEAFESQEYYTYDGSLTTPPYCEQVLWIVFKKLINIHCSQVIPFRSITNGNTTICCNVRDIQPLNGRIVYDATAMCHCPDEICKKKRKKLKRLKKLIL